ncbi:TonB-dependent receptor [Sphingomonas astaxanthinifaciens]|uniref:TonB-dependent receptor n=1 Tax=Sphingomonas astaxanthinifaciens DSM 22298 TaxID=1123267 RepID=A0ABQ5Z9G0_9SPHN|nr:TonB-dependent receptor [Sphingomonas astaxanthinifaciens]GLR48619.1 TonB-dependent receptor [Sphingomonas astaxanthinifaciens DSM 22298]
MKLHGAPARLALALLAGTALSQPAFAQSGPNDTPPTPEAQAASDGQEADTSEIVVTAQKREENLQNVPISIQAIGTRRLDQLGIANFEEYTKQLPSVSFQTAQPGVTVVYMRGVATGGDGNHSGSLPSVGTYLDEQPVTTIGGTLDVHIYDVARIESLAGPQGTLYGASSQAGTIRIITNKPQLGVTSGRIDGEVNKVAHGDWGGKLEGMINLPVTDRIAFRGVGFWQHDAGYIDNIRRPRTYYENAADLLGSPVPVVVADNAPYVGKDLNKLTTYGGRAALKVDLDDNWTVTPTVLYQNMKSDGYFGYYPDLGELKTDRFFDEFRNDEFVQAALTVEGKIGNWDLTYAGAYLDRKTASLTDYTDYADTYDDLYSEAGLGGLAYFYFQDSAGNYIDPRQRIEASDHFKKMSQELRIASPSTASTRFIAGAFFQRQSNQIFQDYIIDGLAPNLSVNGRPETLWLTRQERIDKDYALFGEISQDIGSKITLTAGGRLFKFDNSLYGFFGFGRDFNGPPYNGAGSSRTGVAGCYTTTGQIFRDNPNPAAIITDGRIPGTFCTNLADFKNGKLVPKRNKGDGFTHRLNVQYKPSEGLMFYGTWSRGFRPGGINRRATVPPYDPDYLTNFEAGWKVSLADNAVRWNGAVFTQKWKKFQYSFLGENSFTEIRNGSDARIKGIESDISYVGGGLTLNAAAAYTDAKTLKTICSGVGDVAPCDASFVSAPKGTRLPVTPRFKASATARYAFPVASYKGHVQVGVAHQSSAAATLRQAIQLVGTGDIVNPNDYLGRIRGSTLVDFTAGLDFRKFEAEFFVNNVFDKLNDLSVGSNCGSCLRPVITPGTPRTMGIRLGARF